MFQRFWKILKPVRKIVKKFLNTLNLAKHRREIDTLYALLYNLVHDLDRSLDLTAEKTRQAFRVQWDQWEEGEYMMSDPWFRDNCTRILCEEEIHIKPEWFQGKNVLDAGCGSGRWSYTLAKLDAHVTAVDINSNAVEKTCAVLKDFNVKKEFHISPLETLSDNLSSQNKFDLVWCWGVLHHPRILQSLFDYGYHFRRPAYFLESGVPWGSGVLRYPSRFCHWSDPGY